MQNPNPIQLVFYNSHHFEELNLYELDKSQMEFTVSVHQSIKVQQIESISDKQPVTILYHGKPIGYFVLDFSEDKLNYTNSTDSVLLRSLSLNPDFQGKGFGKQAMLLADEFVKIHFPDMKRIVLSVNFRNLSAYELYKKTGYTDTGRVFEGIKGPQHIMEKFLVEF